MITSTRQYTITRTRATEVRSALAELRHAPVGDMLPPEKCVLQLAALRGTRDYPEAERRRCRRSPRAATKCRRRSSHSTATVRERRTSA
jgi:hypothetical protein